MLSENLDVFFDAFASPVVFGKITGKGIMDAPSNIIADGMILTTDYLLTVKTAVFGSAKYGDNLTVDGVAYKVRESRQIDDGKLSEILLTRV
jgi:hypothetical protein